MELTDLRDDPSELYSAKEVIQMIPEDIHVYSLKTEFERGRSSGESVMVVDGQFRMVPKLRRMYKMILMGREEGKRSKGWLAAVEAYLEWRYSKEAGARVKLMGLKKKMTRKEVDAFNRRYPH